MHKLNIFFFFWTAFFAVYYAAKLFIVGFNGFTLLHLALNVGIFLWIYHDDKVYINAKYKQVVRFLTGK